MRWAGLPRREANGVIERRSVPTVPRGWITTGPLPRTAAKMRAIGAHT
jgi:hypothetical protein